MKTFNLEKALVGEPIKHLKTEQKAYIIGESKSAKYRKDCYVVQVENINEADEDILTVEYITSLKMNYVMWEEPTPTVTLELPCPPENVEDRKFGIFISDVYCRRLTKDIYFAKREDIEEWVRALSNLLTIKKEQEIKELENATTN